MLASLFQSDKAPFILAVTLSILSWFLTTTITNLSEVIVLGVRESRTSAGLTYTVTNHSIKRSLANAVFNFTCRKDACLSALDGGRFVATRDVPPYAIQGNKICYQSGKNFGALATLPPTAQIVYEVKPTGKSAPIFTFAGVSSQEADNCPKSESLLSHENVWIIEGCSISLLLIKYYNHLLVTAFLLTAMFLVYLLVMAVTPSTEDRRT